MCREPATRQAALAAVGRLARSGAFSSCPVAEPSRMTSGRPARPGILRRHRTLDGDPGHGPARAASLPPNSTALNSCTCAAKWRPSIDAGKVPVLAPHAWMRAADPLPHSWDITSDSIAAFIAGSLDASELILLKPVDGPVDALVDGGFAAACPPALRVRIATPATLAAPGCAMTRVQRVTQALDTLPRQRSGPGPSHTAPRTPTTCGPDLHRAVPGRRS